MKGKKIVKGVFLLKTIADRIQKIAKRERRSFSQVAGQMLEDQLKIREGK